jgi:GT2 family glycosyltransferase
MAPLHVAIIVLNWNTAQDTLECVDSLKRLSYQNFSVIVIDNGSTDDSVTVLRAEEQDYLLVETGVNLGYAGGNNVGARLGLERGADAIWFLNNDTVVDPDSLSVMVDTLQLDRVGVVGSVVLFHDGYHRQDLNAVQHDGGFINWHTGETFSFNDETRRTGNTPYVSEVIHGASMLVRREVLAVVGSLPELYFLNYEETDYCVQVRRAGWRLMIDPRSHVWHKVSSSLGQASEQYYYYMHRNVALFMRRHGTFWQQLLFWPQYVFWMVKGYVVWSVRRRSSPRKVFIQAMYDGILNHTGKALL